MVVRVTSTALGSLALSRFRPFPAAWTSGPALTAVPLRVFENYWSHSCETPWRPFLVPVKKVEISERESIQEFFRESKRQILEEACLVFSGQLHLLVFFSGFWTGGGPRPDSYTPLVAQGRAACGQTSWWNTIRENYRVSYKTFTIFFSVAGCWLKSTFPVVRFTTKLFFFFVFLKKIRCALSIC